MKSKNICKFVPDTIPDKLDIHCFIYESDPETMSTPMVFNHHRAILVKQGSGKFHFDDMELAFSAGNLFFAFAGESFYATGDNECEYMYISFSGSRADSLFRRFLISKPNRRFPDFDAMIPFWHDSLSRASETNIDLAAESVLLYTFSRLKAPKSEKNNLINDIIELTEHRFREADLSLATLSGELAYNPKYISHIFKEKMGMGYSEYLRTLRIKYAITLIDHGLDSVKNIALLSGFNDPLYFSTVFKKVVGITPKEYKLRSYSADLN